MLYEITYLAVYVSRPHHGSDRLFGDFFAFWSFARFAHAMPAKQIYDLATLQDFQKSLAGGLDGFYPFPYPPIFLLYLWPLGWLGYLPAFGLWITTTFGAYLAAVARHDWRTPSIWLAIAAPTTLFGIISGQNGFLAAALMIGGFRVIARRPVLGGIILGGLAFKPQLFLLVPIMLLAARQWRGLAGLAMSVLGLTAASVLVFGWTIWWRWLQALPTFMQVFEDNRQRLGYLMPTVTASLREAGLGGGAAEALQAAVTLSVIACLWGAFRHGARDDTTPRPLDIAALQVGVFLVTPYGFIYDMPMVTSAIATAYEIYTRTGRPWRAGEVAVLVAALLVPMVMYTNMAHGWPVGSVVLLLLFAVIVRAGRTRRSRFSVNL